MSQAAGMMHDMPPEPSPGHPLVGRRDELAHLCGLLGVGSLAGSASPAGSAVLLAGDAGVGKTRLLTELRDSAHDAGWRVLVGHCLDFGDGAPPYLPLSEAFGRLEGDSPELAAALAESNPAVARLMPRRRLLSDTDSSSAQRMDRADLFEAVHAALGELAHSAPLLLLLEDVHWADQSTREMISFLLVRQLPDSVSLVASYRSDDLHRRHPLRAATAEWTRLRGVSRVQLAPLADAEIRALVRELRTEPLRESQLRRIVERAEGNAFFTEELVAASGLGSAALPTDLADLLLLRLDHLDDTTRLAVRAASVAGRRVSHELLSRVVGIDGDSLERVLRSAVDNNVLVPVGVEGYAFRHALLAEAVYDDLLPGERVRLHSTYATALAAGEVEGTAAELARHARLAHDLATATRASIQAGDEAMAIAGPDEAARHYELALELLTDETWTLGDQPVDIVALTLKAAEAAVAAGHPYRAAGLLQDQLQQLPADAPSTQRAQLLVALATVASITEAVIDTLAITTEALQLVPDTPPTALRARVLNVHAKAQSERHRDDDAVRWAEATINLARQLDLADVVADAATTLARVLERAGDPEAAQRAFERSAAEARAVGDVTVELRSMHNLGGLHYEHARLDQALSVYQATAARARKTGRPWAPYGLDARVMAAIVAYVSGDWDEAERLGDITGQAPPVLAEASLASVQLSISAGRGYEHGLDLLPQIRPWWDHDGMIAIYTASAAIDLYGDRGDLAAAEAMFDDAVALLTELWQLPAFQAKIRLSGLLLGQLATAAARSSGAERKQLVQRGRTLVDGVDIVVQRGLLRSRRRGPEGDAWVARVKAEEARLRWLAGVDAPSEEELVTAWETTVAAFERFGHVFETARSQARLAAVLRAVGHESDQVTELVGHAGATAKRLGARPLLGELQLLGGTTTTPTQRTPAARPETLTSREHEVLSLIAQGRSNREIGLQLYISPKTVSVHVSNILAKLDASSRTEAVALARRRGVHSD